MKNWKIPAVILALVCFGGYWVFKINFGMGTTLFIGEFAYDIKGIRGILIIPWLVLILSAVIWLLFVLPWKRMKIKLRSYKLMRNWRIPVAVLVLLIIAITLRWDVDKSTNSNIVSKWNTDRWNGSIQNEVLTVANRRTYMVQGPMEADWNSSESLTFIWGGLTGVSVIWLLYAVSKTKRIKLGQEGE